ncbi:hypothetical protein C8J56DRAFT_903976 [Mycena floridula]|nr:hypothetical protein C8J56DRAFT_903976 [Mycena floridula]
MRNLDDYDYNSEAMPSWCGGKRDETNLFGAHGKHSGLPVMAKGVPIEILGLIARLLVNDREQGFSASRYYPSEVDQEGHLCSEIPKGANKSSDHASCPTHNEMHAFFAKYSPLPFNQYTSEQLAKAKRKQTSPFWVLLSKSRGILEVVEISRPDGFHVAVHRGSNKVDVANTKVFIKDRLEVTRLITCWENGYPCGPKSQFDCSMGTPLAITADKKNTAGDSINFAEISINVHLDAHKEAQFSRFPYRIAFAYEPLVEPIQDVLWKDKKRNLARRHKMHPHKCLSRECQEARPGDQEILEATKREVQEKKQKNVIERTDAFMRFQRPPVVLILTDTSHPLWTASDVRDACGFNQLVRSGSKRTSDLVAFEWIQIACRLAARGAVVKVFDKSQQTTLREPVDLVLDIFKTLIGDTTSYLRNTLASETPVWPARHSAAFNYRELRDKNSRRLARQCTTVFSVICVDSVPLEAFTLGSDGYDEHIGALPSLRDTIGDQVVRFNEAFTPAGHEELLVWVETMLGKCITADEICGDRSTLRDFCVVNVGVLVSTGAMHAYHLKEIVRDKDCAVLSGLFPTLSRSENVWNALAETLCLPKDYVFERLFSGIVPPTKTSLSSTGRPIWPRSLEFGQKENITAIRKGGRALTAADNMGIDLQLLFERSEVLDIAKGLLRDAEVLSQKTLTH